MNEVTTTGGFNNGLLRPDAVTTSSSSTGKERPQGGKGLPLGVNSQSTLQPVKRQESRPSMEEQLQAAVAQMNEYVQNTQRDLRFSYDDTTGNTVVRVLDRQTEEVIRQIPDEVFLRLARSLKEEDPVRLFSAQA